MKKIIVSLLFSGSVLANSAQQEQQVNMVLAMMESMGELSRMAECIDLPQARLKNVYQQTLMECGVGNMAAEEPDPQHTACLKSSLVKRSGVAAERWQACDRDNDADTADPLMAELDALSERIGEREPTAAEQRQMDQLIERMQQRGVADMQQMVDAMIAGSQGSETSVTLPVYPEAKLLINIPSQGEIEIAEQRYITLPGASFVTTASPAQVLEFYRQQLPGYRMHRSALSAATDVAYMQNIPVDFDYSRDFGRAFSIPHIYIQPAKAGSQQQLPGAQTLFFVYYQPAE